MSQTTPNPGSSRPSQRSLAEWVTFWIASLIVIAIGGLIVYAWQTEEKQPPLISVTQDGVTREAEGNFYVPFAITNTGGGTAESVQVIAELRVQGEVEESGEQQIDFLSGGETESGAFVFTRNPKEGEIILRVASYKLP
jgi:uncharacterized protein (TIGR02588 family)